MFCSPCISRYALLRIAPIHGATISLIEPDGIYRAGLATCLSALATVARVDCYASAEEAWASDAIEATDLAIVDVEIPHAGDVVARLRDRHGRRVMMSTARWERAEVVEAIDHGAVGVLWKQGLTVDALGAQIRAALAGAGVVPPELLGRLLTADQRAPGAVACGVLTSREQDVLRLFAEGRATREVALEMSYSERTVKTVLRDVVLKLGARSRSQAIASAVRQGLI